MTKMAKVVADLGCTLSQVAIAWCLKNTDVSTVILGASTMDQLIENLASLAVVNQLDPSIMDKIDRIFIAK